MRIRLTPAFATKATIDSPEKAEERDAEIRELAEKTRRTVKDDRRLNQLEREKKLIRRAGDLRQQRLQSDGARIEELEATVRKLQRGTEPSQSSQESNV